MVSELLSCPYCNAHVPLAAPLARGQRVRCPRCQELFVYRRVSTEQEGFTANATSLPPSPGAFEPDHPGTDLPELSHRRPNRAVAGMVLAVMGTMAILGLVFALLTQQLRRQLDYRDQAADPGPPTVVAVPPAQLPALGYLPRDTDVILGVHVAEARQSPLGQALLARLNLGTGDFSLSSLEQTTGLQPENVDHVVLGLKIEDRLLPRVTLVVQTRRPYEPEKVLAALKASRRAERGQKTLFRFSLKQPPVDVAVWCADKQSLIFGLTPEDLDEVPLTPSREVDRFPSPLRKLLTEQAPDGARAWLLGHVERWEKTAAQLLWLTLTKEAQETLAGVQTLALWLTLDADVSFRGTLACVDANAAKELHRYLNRQLGKPEELAKFFRIGPETEAVTRELARIMRCNQEQREVRIHANLSTEFLNRTFPLSAK